MFDKKEDKMPSLLGQWSGDNFLSYVRNLEPSKITNILFAYIVLLVGYLFAVRLATPIMMTDTDMWYHLNGGRYFWETGIIPKTAFFSFIEPKREWINYFWGFQAALFKIFEYFGYQGLIVFRTLLFVTTIGLVFAFIFSQRKIRENPILFLVLAVLIVTILSSRSTAVRPHLISFLFIISFIYILQCRKRLSPLLPLLVVLWANMHGVEWVIGGLICGAYFVDFLYTKKRAGEIFNAEDLRYLASILACSVALFANPYGIGILKAPFAHDPYIFLVINELREVNPELLYSFKLKMNDLDLSTSVTLLGILSLISLVTLAWRGRIRISHFLMAAGGAYLLTKGVRFFWEWALLSLPLVHAFISEYEFVIKRKSKNLALRALLITYFSLMPFVTLASQFSSVSSYPFDSRRLPVELTEFLKRNDAKGNLLAHPGIGGYLQWKLYPEVKIYIDMEFPPFNGSDLYTGLWWQKDKQVLDNILDAYQVDYILVGVDKKNFPEMAPMFAPVFVGDAHVLFANMSTQANIVERFEIKKINPFHLLDESLTPQEIVEEVKKIETMNPKSLRVNKVLAMTLFDEKKFGEALIYAKKYQEYYPLDPNSHYWVGNILEHLDQCDRAIQHYKKAIELTSDSVFIIQVQRQIGVCEYFNKNFDAAHYWFSKSINPYRHNENSQDIYQFAYSTAIVGERGDAIKLLDMLLLRLDPEEEEMRKKAERFKRDLMSKQVPKLGIIDWLKTL